MSRYDLKAYIDENIQAVVKHYWCIADHQVLHMIWYDGLSCALEL